MGLTCCITFFDGMTFDIVKNKIADSDEQDKKKGVNWQPSVDREAVQAQVLPATEPIAAVNQDLAETAAVTRQESVSKIEQGAGQTGTAKRKKKKKEKEEVFISNRKCKIVLNSFF